MKKKILFVIPPERFNEEELNYPKDILTEKGIEVIVSSTIVGEITGDFNGKAHSVVEFFNTSMEDYDMIAIIGGTGTIDHLWNNEQLINYLKKAHEKNILISGICAGSVVIAETGLLENRTGTCYPVDVMKNKLKENKVQYLEENVVIHEDIITSNGPMGAKDFGTALLNLY